VLLDAAQRIRSIFPLAGPRDLALKVQPHFTSLSKDESLVHAPVLIIRDVLHLDLCAGLIACWRENETKPFDDPAMAVNSGRRAVTHRVDHWLQSGRLASEVSESISRRVVPEMQRVFNFQPSGVEQYRIGCYAAAQDQSFRPHRDNRSADTAHRRYSLSISLNTEEYTGGRLRFAEYGPREYGGRSGWALVFSSSLVHEVTSVTSGVRFALITHFLDDSRLGVPVRQASTPLTAQT
jgi:2-oxoglutarate-Fe(II)-dependent oxygenase superfamily protein